jgi:peptidyl-prolyl cis-trans isomerase B (cyclophilin B)
MIKKSLTLLLTVTCIAGLTTSAFAENRFKSKLKSGSSSARSGKKSTAASGVKKAEPSTAATTPAVPASTEPDAAHFVISANGATENIVIKLRPDLAPATVEAFRRNIESGFYRGLAFHRVIRNYLVQIGDPQTRDDNQKELWGTADIGQSIPREAKGLHKRYTVSMAHRPGESTSSGSQFFILLRDADALDGQFTVFGDVVQGTDVLNRLSGAIVDSNDVPLKRIEVSETKLVRSDTFVSDSSTSASTSKRKKTKPEAQKGAFDRFMERVW